MGSILGMSGSQNARTFLGPFWHLKSQKSPKNTQTTKKTQYPESSLEKMWFQNGFKTAKCWFYIVITVCFERSDILNLGGFWSPFGSLLEALFDTFGKKVGFGSSKTGLQTKERMMQKGHVSNFRCWLWIPKRVEARSGAQMLSLAKMSKKLTSKVQRPSYAKVPKGMVADIFYIQDSGCWAFVPPPILHGSSTLFPGPGPSPFSPWGPGPGPIWPTLSAHLGQLGPESLNPFRVLAHLSPLGIAKFGAISASLINIQGSKIWELKVQILSNFVI